MTSSQRKDFNVFAIVNLIPFEVLLVIFGIFSIYLDVSSGHFSFLTLLFAPIFLIIPLGVLLIPTYICYLLFRLSKTLIIRILILYSFWVLMIFLALKTFFVGLGGASMAYVGGGLTSQSLHNQTSLMAMKIFGLAHIIIFPWIYISFLLMKRFIPDV